MPLTNFASRSSKNAWATSTYSLIAVPTGRRARFASGLSVLDFMKRTSFIQMDQRGLAAIGPAAIALAEAEGLPAHAHSVKVRLK